MRKFENKIALITGGANGMGANHTRRFIAEGATVYFTDIMAEEGKLLENELDRKGIFIYQDVSSEQDWLQVINTIEAKSGKLDILVNNAGIAFNKPIEDTTLSDYMRMTMINQVSVFLGQKYCLPLLKNGEDACIINISSTAGLTGMIGSSAYCSSKYAVRGLTQVAALEFSSFNIRVNSIHPGLIDTRMAKFDDFQNLINDTMNAIPLKRIGKQNELTNMVLFLASADASYCTGAEFVVDGGSLAKF